MSMTAKQAAEFAGCSVSTLKRYECGLCERTALQQLMHGCGAFYGFSKCDPMKKDWPPTAKKAKQALVVAEIERLDRLASGV